MNRQADSDLSRSLWLFYLNGFRHIVRDGRMGPDIDDLFGFFST